MVQWIRQNSLSRLTSGVLHSLGSLFHRLLDWLDRLLGHTRRHLLVSQRLLQWMVRPHNPNNLFVAGLEAAHEMEEVGVIAGAQPQSVVNGPTLLYAAPQEVRPSLDATALSLWKGARRVEPNETEQATAAVNRRFSCIDLMQAQLAKLAPKDVNELDMLVYRLTRKWMDIDESFEYLPRRNRLDVQKTLRHNIPRYAGKVLDFRWATKERPIAKLAKPAKLLVIGDVSHSMVHAVSIMLYFFHKLNFRFSVDSYVFSEKATHASPFLNGPGTFQEKMQRLVAGAKSWNAGTRFGSALEEVANQARVDEYTYVIIATDGKVSLRGSEPDKIERYMKALRAKARQVIFLTPSVEFSNGASGKMNVHKIGAFRSGVMEIPIFEAGPPLWYGVLGQYADRIYLVRTVKDLLSMTEDLVHSAQAH